MSLIPGSQNEEGELRWPARCHPQRPGLPSKPWPVQGPRHTCPHFLSQIHELVPCRSHARGPQCSRRRQHREPCAVRRPCFGDTLPARTGCQVPRDPGAPSGQGVVPVSEEGCTPTLVAPPQMSFPEACLCYDLTSVCTMIRLVYLVPFLACEVPRERDLLAWLFQPVCFGGGAAIGTVVLTERPQVPCQFRVSHINYLTNLAKPPLAGAAIIPFHRR